MYAHSLIPNPTNGPQADAPVDVCRSGCNECFAHAVLGSNDAMFQRRPWWYPATWRTHAHLLAERQTRMRSISCVANRALAQ